MKLERLPEENGLVRVACAGEVSQIRFRAEGNPLEDLLGPGCAKCKVLINFEKAEWIDSSGISWLIVTHKLFTEGGGMVVLHSLPPRIKNVLQFCRIDTVLNVTGDEASAHTLAQKGRG